MTRLNIAHTPPPLRLAEADTLKNELAAIEFVLGFFFLLGNGIGNLRPQWARSARHVDKSEADALEGKVKGRISEEQIRAPNGKLRKGYKVTGNDGIELPADDGTIVRVPKNGRLQADGMHGDEFWEVFDNKGRHLGEYDARDGTLNKGKRDDALRPYPPA